MGDTESLVGFSQVGVGLIDVEDSICSASRHVGTDVTKDLSFYVV